ncbi:DUF2489 domain-containing protein [Conservatibacter flavescens]|uniref:DUF2489 domain-containing protein n=1 Tax=Conservatibacter flavescens TaxID=28161 RepID=A0A2M8S1S0_9PAST|nr:DUF2489 domain-containing protein [Conservatibacter flavescens]PJG85109.1 DUF2489 domain-containing protein [Conservatibacter flavescens]
MWITILAIIGTIIIVGMGFYAVKLLLALRKQNQAFQQARLERINRLTESITIIAQAMQNKECNHSEGVIRLRMLLEPLGKKLNQYPAMYELFTVVQDMPTHEARRELIKKDRMRLDLTRESAEAKLEENIMLELRQLLSDVKNY